MARANPGSSLYAHFVPDFSELNLDLDGCIRDLISDLQAQTPQSAHSMLSDGIYQAGLELTVDKIDKLEAELNKKSADDIITYTEKAEQLNITLLLNIKALCDLHTVNKLF